VCYTRYFDRLYVSFEREKEKGNLKNSGSGEEKRLMGKFRS
jgi:hypothetical protein